MKHQTGLPDSLIDADEPRLRARVKHIQKWADRGDHRLPREVAAALAEASRATESVSFAAVRGLIGRAETIDRLAAAHQLRADAVAKLPADHPEKCLLDAFIQHRGAALTKLLIKLDR